MQQDSKLVENNSSFLLTQKMEGGDQIFIKGLDGRMVAIDLPNKLETTFKEVKLAVQAKLGVNFDVVTLIYGGIDLKEENSTLAKAGIPDESILHLIKTARGGSQIFEKVLERKTISFELPDELNKTTDEIFHSIPAKLSMNLEGFDLVYGGEIVISGKTLLEASLQNEATLHLVRKVEGGNRLQIKNKHKKLKNIDLLKEFDTTKAVLRKFLFSKNDIRALFSLIYKRECLAKYHNEKNST